MNTIKFKTNKSHTEGIFVRLKLGTAIIHSQLVCLSSRPQTLSTGLVGFVFLRWCHVTRPSDAIHLRFALLQFQLIDPPALILTLAYSLFTQDCSKNWVWLAVCRRSSGEQDGVCDPDCWVRQVPGSQWQADVLPDLHNHQWRRQVEDCLGLLQVPRIRWRLIGLKNIKMYILI